MNKELEDIILYIKDNVSYKKCIELKEKMSSNVEITDLVEKVKNLQRAYAKSDFKDEDIKKQLDIVNDKLNNIPIYVSYLRYLDEVNDMIDFVKEELNDYFNKLLNENN